MATDSSLSKYKYDDNIFMPEPPDNPKHVVALFCGRKKELECGINTLKNGIDLYGKRMRKYDKKPWIIHGESRSGKSHLARRIMASLPKNKKRLQLYVPARERLEALAVMTNLFEQIRFDFSSRINNVRNHQIIQNNPWIHLTIELIGQISLFIGHTTESVTIKISETLKNGLNLGLNLHIIPKVVEFFAAFSSEQSETKATELKLRPPNAVDMAEYCGIMIDTLMNLKLLNHLLILIDDIDLLEGYVDQTRNATKQRSQLSQAILKLSSTSGIDVLITARSWYAHSKKEFKTLIDLAMEPEMKEEELIEIHDQHFKLFSPRDYPNKFLTKEALLNASTDVRGIPGIFLQHLDTAFRVYKKEEEWGERDYAWYLDIFRRIYSTFRLKCPAAAIALETAVNEQRFTIDIETTNPFYSTVFDNEFVFQSYYRETTYFMDTLVTKVIDMLESIE